MRTIAINVKSGGLHAGVDGLVDRAIAYAADVYVVSEYRDTNIGGHIRTRLRSAGAKEQAFTPGLKGNGVLVASRLAFHAIHNPAVLGDDQYPGAMIECIFSQVHVIGCYLPGQDRKRPHLEYLRRAARSANERGERLMAIGDLNSGRNETDIEANALKHRLVDEFSTAPLYRELESELTEAWLHRHPNELEYSWYPRMGTPQHAHGWRLDKALLSRTLLPHLSDAFYDHTFRLDGLTDHSALIVDLAF